MAYIPVHTPSSCDDGAFLPDLAETEPATTDLSEGVGGVSGHNESAESLQLQLEVSTNSEQQTQEVDMEISSQWCSILSACT